MTDIVGVAGPIGAGKSAVADRIARALGAPRRSFGGIVRERASAVGMPTDRETLQAIGDSIIATDGWEQFCRSVVGESAQTVVVDGVRHVGAVGGLARIAGGDRFAVVFVEATEERRRARVAERDGTAESEFDAVVAHPNEREVPLVQRLATIVVANDTENADDLDTVVEHIVRELRRLGFVAAT